MYCIIRPSFCCVAAGMFFPLVPLDFEGSMHTINGITCQPLLPCLLEALIRAGGPDHVTVIMTAITLLREVLEEDQLMGYREVGQGEEGEGMGGDGAERIEPVGGSKPLGTAVPGAGIGGAAAGAAASAAGAGGAAAAEAAAAGAIEAGVGGAAAAEAAAAGAAVAAAAAVSAAALSDAADSERAWVMKQATLGALITLCKAVRELGKHVWDQKGPALIRQLLMLGVLVITGPELERQQQECSGAQQQLEQQEGELDTSSSSSSRGAGYQYQQQQQQGKVQGPDQQRQQEQQYGVAGIPSRLQQQQAVIYVGALLLRTALHAISIQLMGKTMMFALRRLDKESSMEQGKQGHTGEDSQGVLGSGAGGGGGPSCNTAAAAAGGGGGGPSCNTAAAGAGGGGRGGEAAAVTSDAPHMAAHPNTAAAAAAAVAADSDSDADAVDDGASPHAPTCHCCGGRGTIRISIKPRDVFGAGVDVLAQLEKRLLVSPVLGHGYVPTQTLQWAATGYFEILRQMPPEVLQRFEGCLERADWLSGLLHGQEVAIGKWLIGQGSLAECPMMPLDLLRVPTVISIALMNALPVDFACNNPECDCLDGPLELGLVSHRAQVVCGGCGVARYCSRECQEQHWGQHKRVCKALGEQMKRSEV